VGVLCVVPASIDSSDLDRDPKVIRGKSVTLHCPAEGSPFPNITWLKNDRQLLLPASQNEAVGGDNEAARTENEAGEDDKEARLALRMSGRQLEISLARRSDEANYSCVAVNKAGEDAIHFSLQVLGGYDQSHITCNIGYDPVTSTTRYTSTCRCSAYAALFTKLLAT